MLRIGVISDTHDKPYPAVFEAFRRVDRILHAGDICRPAVLEALGRLAPVTAVHGNCCNPALQRSLPARRLVHVDGWTILMQHEIGTPARFRAGLAGSGGERHPELVLFGHSHVPYWNQVEGVWFLNPGSAGPRRFKLRPSAAILTLYRTKPPRVDFLELEKV